MFCLKKVGSFKEKMAVQTIYMRPSNSYSCTAWAHSIFKCIRKIILILILPYVKTIIPAEAAVLDF